MDKINPAVKWIIQELSGCMWLKNSMIHNAIAAYQRKFKVKFSEEEKNSIFIKSSEAFKEIF